MVFLVLIWEKHCHDPRDVACVIVFIALALAAIGHVLGGFDIAHGVVAVAQALQAIGIGQGAGFDFVQTAAVGGLQGPGVVVVGVAIAAVAQYTFLHPTQGIIIHTADQCLDHAAYQAFGQALLVVLVGQVITVAGVGHGGYPVKGIVGVIRFENDPLFDGHRFLGHPPPGVVVEHPPAIGVR